MSRKIYLSKPLKFHTLLTHPTRSFSFSFVLKTKFVYSDLVNRRKRIVPLTEAYQFSKQAPNMVNKLRCNQKLTDSEIHLAQSAGIRFINGVPIPEDRQLFEDFANDTDSLREHKLAIKNNHKEMEKMIKGESENNQTSSESAQSNFQDSSGITSEGDLADYFEDF